MFFNFTSIMYLGFFRISYRAEPEPRHRIHRGKDKLVRFSVPSMSELCVLCSKNLSLKFTKGWACREYKSSGVRETRRGTDFGGESLLLFVLHGRDFGLGLWLMGLFRLRRSSAWRRLGSPRPSSTANTSVRASSWR